MGGDLVGRALRAALALVLVVLQVQAKCMDKVVNGFSHHTESDVTMEWHSTVGDSCLDHEMFQYCDPSGRLAPYGEGWETKYPGATFSSFAVDEFDASQACCICGGGNDLPETATPAPTTTMNTLGGRYIGKKGQKAFFLYSDLRCWLFSNPIVPFKNRSIVSTRPSPMDLRGRT
jgi:hypothetical protein